MSVHIAAILTMVMLAGGQILLKLLAVYIREVDGPLWQSDVIVAVLGRLLAIGAIYGVVFLLWMYVLRSLDLNRAFLYASLTFIFVPLLSYLLLGEEIRMQTMLGTVLIVAGIAVTMLS